MLPSVSTHTNKDNALVLEWLPHTHTHTHTSSLLLAFLEFLFFPQHIFGFFSLLYNRKITRKNAFFHERAFSLSFIVYYCIQWVHDHLSDMATRWLPSVVAIIIRMKYRNHMIMMVVVRRYATTRQIRCTKFHYLSHLYMHTHTQFLTEIMMVVVSYLTWESEAYFHYIRSTWCICWWIDKWHPIYYLLLLDLDVVVGRHTLSNIQLATMTWKDDIWKMKKKQKTKLSYQPPPLPNLRSSHTHTRIFS